jgi:hypothetical protein
MVTHPLRTATKVALIPGPEVIPVPWRGVLCRICTSSIGAFAPARSVHLHQFYRRSNLHPSHADNCRKKPENGTGLIIVRGKLNVQALGEGVDSYTNINQTLPQRSLSAQCAQRLWITPCPTFPQIRPPSQPSPKSEEHGFGGRSKNGCLRELFQHRFNSEQFPFHRQIGLNYAIIKVRSYRHYAGLNR